MISTRTIAVCWLLIEIQQSPQLIPLIIGLPLKVHHSEEGIAAAAPGQLASREVGIVHRCWIETTELQKSANECVLVLEIPCWPAFKNLTVNLPIVFHIRA